MYQEFIKILMAMAVSFACCVATGPILIPALRRLKFGQSVRDDGPQSHLQKQGTPTMGGVMFFLSLVMGTVFWVSGRIEIVYLLLFALGHGIIGLADDYIKIVKHRSLGLTPKQKMAGQLGLALVLLVLGLMFFGVDTTVHIPFTAIDWNMGVLYYPLFIVLAIGTTNAVNLTDGLDGLASGITAVVALGFIALAAVAGSQVSWIFAAALAGSCLGFLVFNHHPAKIFMGDTGSLLLGGAVAGLAVMTETELLLPLIGIVYVAEALSVMIQVGVYKKTKKRVFRMAPLHHHFELGGWSEWKVVIVFWTVTAVAATLCVLIRGTGIWL